MIQCRGGVAGEWWLFPRRELRRLRRGIQRGVGGDKIENSLQNQLHIPERKNQKVGTTGKGAGTGNKWYIGNKIEA